MAVVRVKFPDAGAIESAARALEGAPTAIESENVRAVREIRRAKERPGRTSELTAEEMLRLGAVREHAFPRVRDLLAEKAEEARSLLEHDRTELARRRATTARIRRMVRGEDPDAA